MHRRVVRVARDRRSLPLLKPPPVRRAADLPTYLPTVVPGPASCRPTYLPPRFLFSPLSSYIRRTTTRTQIGRYSRMSRRWAIMWMDLSASSGEHMRRHSLRQHASQPHMHPPFLRILCANSWVGSGNRRPRRISTIRTEWVLSRQHASGASMGRKAHPAWMERSTMRPFSASPRHMHGDHSDFLTKRVHLISGIKISRKQRPRGRYRFSKGFLAGWDWAVPDFLRQKCQKTALF